MKKLLGLSSLLLLLSIMSTANAASYRYDAGHQYVQKGQTVSWNFDFGNTLQSQTVTKATVFLKFKEDKSGTKKQRKKDNARKNERAKLTIGSQVIVWDIFKQGNSFLLSSLASLNLSGILTMQLESVKGDFLFKSAKLKTKSTAKIASTPVPSALLLMGSGLIGVAAAARRKAKKA